ncbi:MAG: SDR family oxidoreductase [Candidatus Eiseniibacteriota bacterium]|nr:MAG: SDR family oxidoreductase [Candidatus Eisenbacteria bacterium]
MSNVLDGKVAVVTGVDTTVGQAVGFAFAQAGAFVALSHDRNLESEGRHETYQLAEDSGLSSITVSADPSKWEDVDRLVTRTVEEFGRLDIAVCGSSIAHTGSATDTTWEDWNLVMTRNVTSAFLLSKRAVQQMLAQGDGGSIIHISSVAGYLLAVPDLCAWSVSKGCVTTMARQMALDYAASGIRVNAISLGAIDAPEFHRDFGQTLKIVTDSGCPMGRQGKPEDVANAALFLASDASSYITGANLTVDGGWSTVWTLLPHRAMPALQAAFAALEK